MTQDKFNFAPAAPDEIIYGSYRPGYPSSSPAETDIEEWIEFMQGRGIGRVCCLLEDPTKYYSSLLDQYRSAFGDEHVLHAPIPDMEIADRSIFGEQIFPFLCDSVREDMPTVVHCSAGRGRTGHVLVLWLVFGRGFSVEDAIAAVRTETRDPLEATTVDELKQVTVPRKSHNWKRFGSNRDDYPNDIRSTIIPE